ncbi:hypothetical protein [Sphingomonas sanguinis]|uniref:hypothetical protein n=1 Tax=Sphingomonas sanguinis TaxID=33051 RepID=UPI00128EBD28|nr:hypothetical protein [Sphingomonas sanguinis]
MESSLSVYRRSDGVTGRLFIKLAAAATRPNIDHPPSTSTPQDRTLAMLRTQSSSSPFSFATPRK